MTKDDAVQKRVFKSTRLWSFYADLEECLGTFLSTKSVYDKLLELRVATPQIVLNYATFLEEVRNIKNGYPYLLVFFIFYF